MSGLDDITKKDIITQMHLSLSLGVDSSSADKFIHHVHQIPAMSWHMREKPEAFQVNWILNYWIDQFDSVGLNCDAFKVEIEKRKVSTLYDFNIVFTRFICECADRHNLPDTSVPLRQI